MKAELKDLTIEMEREELISTLNENLKALNDKAEERETLIIGRLTTMQREIKSFKKEVQSGIDAILNRLEGKNGRKILTDSKKKSGK